MITFPVAKINLGLNVVERRPDGYHNLQTVFMPLPGLRDALEVVPMDEQFPSAVDCDLKVTGMAVEGDEQKNLVVRAYRLLKEEFPAMPRVHAHLHKAIPSQAGMGGGSSDCAAMLSLLNGMFALGLSERQLIDRAARLGADCPFFILGRPAYAEGIGEILQPLDVSLPYFAAPVDGGVGGIVVVRPDIPVPTKEAFALVTPRRPEKSCRDVVLTQPAETWREDLVNDFEQSVFAQHPEIGAIKERLYDLGAVYAAMSGSGSAVFGLFRQRPRLDGEFPGMFTWQG